MARLTEIEDHGGDPILERVFSREQEMFGAVLGPTRMMAHRPGILQAAKALYAACEASGLLPLSLMSLIYARVAAINGCPF